MVKFKKLKVKDVEKNPLVRWLTFLDQDTPEEILKEVIQMDTAIGVANERLEFVSKDKEFLRAYEMREMAMSDLTTVVNTAVEKSKNESARNALIKGYSYEIIQDITGLDIETIKSLG